MYEKDLLSVVILCRNMESYLKTCVDSVLAQGYAPLEVILVCDRTDDPVRAVMDDFCRRNPNVVSQLIFQDGKRGLAGGARNRGMALARGEYITFVDGDDWIADGMYRTMMPAFRDPDVEMANCDYNECFMETGKVVYCPVSEDLPSGTYRPCDTGVMFRRSSYAWNGIYRRALFDRTNVRFYEQTPYDDLAVHVLFAAGKKIAYFNTPFCQHRKHPAELTSTASSEAHCSIIPTAVKMAEQLRTLGLAQGMQDQLNELLIFFFFDYPHYLMRRGSVDVTIENVQACADAFVRCGGRLPADPARRRLARLQLESPAAALEELKHIIATQTEVVFGE